MKLYFLTLLMWLVLVLCSPRVLQFLNSILEFSVMHLGFYSVMELVLLGGMSIGPSYLLMSYIQSNSISAISARAESGKCL